MKGGEAMFAEDNDLELKPEGDAIPDADVLTDENIENEEPPVDAGEAEDTSSGEPEADTQNEPPVESLPE